MTDEHDEHNESDSDHNGSAEGSEREHSDKHGEETDRGADRSSRFGEFREQVEGSPNSARDKPNHRLDESRSNEPDVDEAESNASVPTEGSPASDHADSWEWVGGDDDSNSSRKADISDSTPNTPSSDDSSEPEKQIDQSKSGDTSADRRIWDRDETGEDDTSGLDSKAATDEKQQDEFADSDDADEDDRRTEARLTADNPKSENGPIDEPGDEIATERPNSEPGANSGDGGTTTEAVDRERDRALFNDASSPTEAASDDETAPEAATRNRHDERLDSGGDDEQEGSPKQRRRVWNRDDTSDDVSKSDPQVTDVSEETPSEPLMRGGEAAATSGDLAAGPEDGYQRPDGLAVEPGVSTLVECGSQDDRKHAACRDLLGLEAAANARDVLLIRYRRVEPEQLEEIANAAHRTKLVTVGYSQSVPDAVRDEVEVASINNPNDITRLGILVSGTVKNWTADDRELVVCYDSLNVLLKYKDVQSTFRFLHVFLGTLQGTDVIAHFHVDPLAGDPQNINTLKPLFDEVVSIDSIGVQLE